MSEEIKRQQDLEALARLKKTIKRHNRKHPDRAIHLVPISCTGLCPKNAVTACDPMRDPARLFILRSKDDIKRLAATIAPDNTPRDSNTSPGAPF